MIYCFFNFSIGKMEVWKGKGRVEKKKKKGRKPN
uniref:Uncharacterized protein n=1 Tax=Rhizophora mucronata TaxID=61149 RepID=A0A2P2PAF7_RHIMU